MTKESRKSTTTRVDKFVRVPLDLKGKDFLWPLAFMLTLTMIGLQFPLGWLFLPLILLNRLRFDRYDLMIQLTLFLGGYSIMPKVNGIYMIVFYLGVICMLLLHKPPVLKKAMWLCIFYFAALTAIALTSDEAYSIQFQGLSVYMAIVYLFVPFVIFSGREFDIRLFIRKLYIYAFIFCGYYVIDCVLLNGVFFLAADPSWATYGVESTFFNPWIKPLTFGFVRRWPPGLYILFLLVYPTARMFKLKTWQLLLILAAILVCRTFTVMVALVLGYLLCRSKGRQVLWYNLGFIGGLVALYHIDSMLPEVNFEGEEGVVTKQSTLRVKSSFDQFLDLDIDKADEESLAALGTGRGAQIIPKIELLYRLDRQWLGFGFLSRNLTKRQKYVIENELYNNPEQAEEVATGVESTFFQVLLDVGIVGLIVHVLFLVALYLIVCRLPFGLYFLSCELLFVFVGISGFSGMIRIDGLIMVAMVFAAVIMNEKRQLTGFSLPPIKHKKENATALQ